MSVYIVDCGKIDQKQKENAIKKHIDFLPPDYKSKVLCFVHLKDKIRCLIGYLLIQKYVGGQIERDETNRPFIRSKSDFNISHDGDMVAIIIDNAVENTRKNTNVMGGFVGIDVSEIRPIDYTYFHQTFTSKEFEFIYKDKTNFFILWSLKESYCKLVGTGIITNLLDIEFELTCDTNDYYNCLGKHVQLTVKGKEMDHKFKVEILNNHVLSICVVDSIRSINYESFTELTQ